MHTLGNEFRPAPIHAGGLRYHGMAPLVSHLYELGFLEARAYAQNTCFEAAVQFARTEGIIPAPGVEPRHPRGDRRGARGPRGGESRVILFNLSGHGYFDMAAYDQYLAGQLTDVEYEPLASAEAEVAVSAQDQPSAPGRGRRSVPREAWRYPWAWPRATWNGVVIAESDASRSSRATSTSRPRHGTVRVPEAQRHAHRLLVEGDRSYYTLVVDGSENPDAAWYYPDASEKARTIEGYVAFWKGVTVERPVATARIAERALGQGAPGQLQPVARDAELQRAGVHRRSAPRRRSGPKHGLLHLRRSPSHAIRVRAMSPKRMVVPRTSAPPLPSCSRCSP